MVSRYLVRMVDPCRPHTLFIWDINIEVSPELLLGCSFGVRYFDN